MYDYISRRNGPRLAGSKGFLILLCRENIFLPLSPCQNPIRAWGFSGCRWANTVFCLPRWKKIKKRVSFEWQLIWPRDAEKEHVTYSAAFLVYCCSDLSVTGFPSLPSANSSCAFPSPLLWCRGSSMPAPNAFIFKKRLELLWQQSITSWGCRPGVICGLPAHRDNFLTLHTTYCRGDRAGTKGSMPSEHLVSSLPSPLCFWSWHFFTLRCIHDVTFFVDVLKCVFGVILA